MASLRVCVIDGDAAVRDSLATLMSLSGHEVLAFGTAAEFLAATRGETIGCVICAAQLPDTSGLDLFEVLRVAHPAARFALLLSRTDPSAAAEARRLGVGAVFQKPLVHRRLISFVGTAEHA